MAETKLTVMRVRPKGEPLFLDPSSDIRKVIPAVLEAAVQALEDSADEAQQDDVTYLSQCIRVFQIRILEDTAPVDQQVDEFMQAIGKLPTALLLRFNACLTTMALAVYSLFCRRDAPTDRRELKSLLDFSKVTLYKPLLDASSYQALKEKLQSSVSLLVSNITTRDDAAVRLEDGKIYSGLKDMAAMLIPHKGSGSWNDIAKACDEAFSTGSGKSDTENIALALAYPTYDKLNLVVNMTEEKKE